MPYPDDVKISFLEEIPLRRRWLRRLVLSSGGACPVCPGGYHQAKNLVGDFPSPGETGEDGGRRRTREPDASEYADDAGWPECAPCGYVFVQEDEWQVFERQLYMDRDGVVKILDGAPAGSCWEDGTGRTRGPDGRGLIVRCPDGFNWSIDGRCSNCNLPQDTAHRCWVRHGRPEDGTLHVDKDGLTCSAGAGSIDTGRWHGFLHRGSLSLSG